MIGQKPTPDWIMVLDGLSILEILIETVLPWFFLSEIGHTPKGYMPVSIRIILINFIPFAASFIYLLARTVKIASRLIGEENVASRLSKARYGIPIIVVVMLIVSWTTHTDPHLVYVIFACASILCIVAAFLLFRFLEMRR